LNFAATFEHCNSHKVPAYVLALDIDKAYDSVDRRVLDNIMEYIGVADNNFYKLMQRARDEGATVIKGAVDLSTPFKTTLGIK
jgi:hypothetical protein